jgi:hypothetical protein
MMGPAADDDAKKKVRAFLDGNGLQNVPLTFAAAPTHLSTESTSISHPGPDRFPAPNRSAGASNPEWRKSQASGYSHNYLAVALQSFGLHPEAAQEVHLGSK